MVICLFFTVLTVKGLVVLYNLVVCVPLLHCKVRQAPYFLVQPLNAYVNSHNGLHTIVGIGHYNYGKRFNAHFLQ